MLFKDNPWFSELQQQLMGNAALERYFHIFILVYHPQHSYDFWTMLSHSHIWMNVGRMHPLRLIVGPFVLKSKDALYRMNIGDEHHWWCQCISFHDLIWQTERNPWRRTLSLQRWAFYYKMHTTNQRIILRRIQERKSFMMNQATPHLGGRVQLDKQRE